MEITSPSFMRSLKRPKAGSTVGFFVLNSGVMDYISGDESVWERDAVEKLARDSRLVGYRHYGFWSCMDTLKEKNYLEELWNLGQAPWKIWK